VYHLNKVDFLKKYLYIYNIRLMPSVKTLSNWNVSTINNFFNNLLNLNNNSDVLAGSNGFIRYGAGVVTGVKYEALVVQEDTEFSAFFINGVDVLTARGMSGVTFVQGAYLPGGLDITGWTITSGSVIAY
jgi:hypothetical protein